jgi:hypothetical protein
MTILILRVKMSAIIRMMTSFFGDATRLHLDAAALLAPWGACSGL